ncbi:MAG: hypothetical protein R3B99_11040 [Polyangiales bacterium]
MSTGDRASDGDLENVERARQAPRPSSHDHRGDALPFLATNVA